MQEYATLTELPKSLLDQLIRRYGRPTFAPRYLAIAPDGGNIPVAYATEQDAQSDGVHRTRKVFLKIWTVDAATFRALDDDIALLTMAALMEECPARDGYIRKATARGYTL